MFIKVLKKPIYATLVLIFTLLKLFQTKQTIVKRKRKTVVVFVHPELKPVVEEISMVIDHFNNEHIENY